MELRAAKREEGAEQSFFVEGYATTFNEEYELFRDGHYIVMEQVDKNAFKDTDMSDVVFQIDHEGRVYARTSNGSLIVTPDDEGLHVIADLGRTESARQLYEEIKSGMITKMSWRFTVPDDAYQYDKDAHLLTYSRIGKIYDVSAVSIPANDSTSISARNFVNGLIEEEEARIEAAKRLEERKAAIKAKLGGNPNAD
jgi:HK97 family phage prohead protease